MAVMQGTTTGRVPPVRGMDDVSPERYAALHRTSAAMLDVCRLAGYEAIDVPVVEFTELFLRKAGEERVQQMYSFRYRNRDLSLRPEFTASVLRSVLPTLDAAISPHRYAYCGPVFRYDPPEGRQSRQFTEIGAELLGAAGAAADAEVVATAYAAVEAAGVAAPMLVVGHVGVARGFLAGLALDERVRDWLVWSMERLRPDDPDTGDMHPALAALLAEEESRPAQVSAVPPDRDQFIALLREAGFSLEGNRRTPEEIATGLIRKVARREEGAAVRRALAFLRRLVALRGAPSVVLPELDAVLAAEGLDAAPVERLRAVLDLLPAYGIAPERVRLDLGLGRKLHYYTGMLFEVYGGAARLGGGGRYDELASALGAEVSVPAVGFSLGLERVLDTATPVDDRRVALRVVVRANGDDGARAIVAARRLREAGIVAVLDAGGETSSVVLDVATDGFVLHRDAAALRFAPDAWDAVLREIGERR